jgi:hypothetical protein
MPDHTTTSAAEYLAARGYTVGRGRVGGRGAPAADTIKRWCKLGKIKARKVGWVWLIAEETLAELVKKSAITTPDTTP